MKDSRFIERVGYRCFLCWNVFESANYVRSEPDKGWVCKKCEEEYDVKWRLTKK